MGFQFLWNRVQERCLNSVWSISSVMDDGILYENLESLFNDSIIDSEISLSGVDSNESENGQDNSENNLNCQSLMSELNSVYDLKHNYFFYRDFSIDELKLFLLVNQCLYLCLYLF